MAEGIDPVAAALDAGEEVIDVARRWSPVQETGRANLSGVYRELVLLIAMNQCEACGWAPACADWLHLHHLRPVRHRGGHQPENLIVLCATCHSIIEWLIRHIGHRRFWSRARSIFAIRAALRTPHYAMPKAEDDLLRWVAKYAPPYLSDEDVAHLILSDISRDFAAVRGG